MRQHLSFCKRESQCLSSGVRSGVIENRWPKQSFFDKILDTSEIGINFTRTGLGRFGVGLNLCVALQNLHDLPDESKQPHQPLYSQSDGAPPPHLVLKWNGNILNTTVHTYICRIHILPLNLICPANAEMISWSLCMLQPANKALMSNCCHFNLFPKRSPDTSAAVLH